MAVHVRDRLVFDAGGGVGEHFVLPGGGVERGVDIGGGGDGGGGNRDVGAGADREVFSLFDDESRIGAGAGAGDGDDGVVCRGAGDCGGSDSAAGPGAGAG